MYHLLLQSCSNLASHIRCHSRTPAPYPYAVSNLQLPRSSYLRVDRTKRAVPDVSSAFQNMSSQVVAMQAESRWLVGDSGRSEDAVDDVAADRGASAEYSSIAHLLAKFLSVLFQFAWLPLARVKDLTIGDSEGHVSVVGRWGRCRHARSLLLDHSDIAAREDTFHACSFVPASPPYISLVISHETKSIRYVQSLFMCSSTWIRSFCCSARSPASVGL